MIAGIRLIVVPGLFISALLPVLFSGVEVRAQDNTGSRKQAAYPYQGRDSVTIYLDSARSLAERSPIRAVGLLNRAIELSTRRNDPVHAAQAYLVLGNIQQRLGQHDLAVENYRRCLSEQPEKKDVKRFSEVSRSKGYASGHIALSDPSMLFEACRQLAVSLDALNRDAEALRYINRCLGSEFTGIDAARKRGAKRILAGIRLKRGEHRAALELLNEVLREEQAARNGRGEAETLLALAGHYRQEGNEIKAADYYTQAKKRSDQAGATDLSIRANEGLAQLYRLQQNVGMEIQARNSNIEMNQRAGQPAAIKKEQLEIGNAYLNSSEYERAEPYLKKALEDNEGSFANDPGFSANGIIRDVEAPSAGATEQKNIPEEIPALFGRSIGLEEGANAYKRLAEGFLRKNELKKAAEYFDRYARLQDSARLVRETELAEAIRLGTDMGKNQQRIELLEKERELINQSLELLKQDRLLKEEQLRSRNLAIGVLAGCLLLMVAGGVFMIRNYRARRRSDKLLALQSLGGQMNPHFIFNALNSVNQYISRNEEREANRYLSGFSKLMRQVMDSSRHTFIPIGEEVELLRLYLQLEHDRFGEQFGYRLEVAEELPGLEFELPPMMIQPYIENAIWHGLRYIEERGELLVRFERSGNTLLVTIADNGIGLKKSRELKTRNQQKQNSLGMQNIETRVQLMNAVFGTGIRVETGETHPGAEHPGTTVKLFIPQKRRFNF